MKTVLVTNNSTLNISIFDKSHPEIEPLDLIGEAAIHYIESFYRNKIKNVIGTEYDHDLTMRYENYDLELKNYAQILENSEYKKLFTPIIKNAMEYESIHENKLPKKKKVKRENKYVKEDKKNKNGNKHIIKTIAVSAVTLSLLMSIGKMSGKLDTKTSKEVLENMPDTYTIANIVEDEVVQEVEAASATALETLSEIQEEPVVEEVKQVVSVEHKEVPENSDYVQLDYSDRSSTDKANTTRENYSNVIENYCKTYGLDSDLIIALATQERGVHGTTLDPGGATGLMQIQNSVWDNGTLRAYNFDTESWEQITVNIPSLSDLDYNVKVGCMIFQDCLRYNDYNIIAAIQAYNMGYGTTDILISDYCNETGKTRDQVLADQNDTGWLKYRNTIPYGDPNYVENVLSFYGENGTINVQKPDGSICSVTVGNETKQAKSL